MKAIKTETDQQIKDINDMLKAIRDQKEGQELIYLVWRLLIRALPLRKDND